MWIRAAHSNIHAQTLCIQQQIIYAAAQNLGGHPWPTLTAIPLRSVEKEAAVGLELATVAELVSDMKTFSGATPKHLAATCKTKTDITTMETENNYYFRHQ